MNEVSFGYSFRRVAALAFPAIISNVTVPILGLSDTAVAGHLGSPSFLAAMAAGGMMMNVIFLLFGFLRMGSTGLTAEAYGAKDEKSLSRIFSLSFGIAVAVGLAMILLSIPLCRLLLIVIDPAPEVAGLAATYFYICIFGAPAQLVVMTLNGWMVGMQNTFRPMVVSISVNLVNIALSLTAVFLLHLGFKGVALGTLAANWFGAALAFFLARGLARGRRLFTGWRDILDSGLLRRFFSLNTNLFFRSACIMAVSMGVTSIGARLGTLEMAVNALLMQFFLFFSYFMDGFAYAAEALCGKSYGERNRHALFSSVKASLLWSALMVVAFTLVYLLFTDGILSLLTTSQEVVAAASSLRPWILLLPLVSVSAFIFDGFFVGLMVTRRMLISTFAGMILFFGVALFHPCSGSPLFSLPDNRILWTAFLSYLLCRGIMLAFQLRPAVNSRIPKY